MLPGGSATGHQCGLALHHSEKRREGCISKRPSGSSTSMATKLYELVIWPGYSIFHLQSLCGGTLLDHRILHQLGAMSLLG